MNTLGFGSKVSAVVDRVRGLESDIKPHGYFKIEHYDKYGNLLSKYDIPNGVCDAGINDLLDVAFRNQTQHASWYIGIIDNSGYSAVAAGDTMASHSGWNEFTTYSQTTRVQWSPAAASSKSISNSSTSDFSITGSGTLKGIFLCSDSTKSGTSGILWATALFAATITVSNGDTLKITYTVNGS
jgi:hypothetical protein